MLNFVLTGGFSVFAGVGERTREGNDLYREMIESGVIKLGEKQVHIVTCHCHCLSLQVFFHCYSMAIYVVE